MKILLIAATEAEIAPLIKQIQEGENTLLDGFGQVNGHSVKIMVMGVGVVATTYNLTKELYVNKYDLVIQAGIAGSFNRGFKLGDVVFVNVDRFGDLGAEDKNQFLDVADLGLANEQIFENNAEVDLPKVSAITVHTVAGSQSTIDKRVEKYQPQLETMEGAALHYVCESEAVKYIQVRGISNYVEERNKASWQIDKAVINLNDWLMQYLTA